ncbi:MAG: hypothetical protein WEE89_11640 [Gemmatimonadota bacterium]
MSTIQLFAPAPSARIPNYRTVILNQFRLIDMSKRFTLLMVIIAAGVSPLLQEKTWNYGIDTAPIPVLIFSAMVWPLFIWQGETRTRRTYHRWLPVDQVAHDFAKIIAGGIWLVLAFGLTLGTLKLVGALVFPGAVLSTLALLGLLVGCLLVYGLFSLLPILTDKPLHWFIGIWPAVMLVNIGLELLHSGLYVLDPLISAPLGAATALFGMIAFEWRGLDYLSPVTQVTNWLIALMLWSMLVISLLYLASRWANRGAEA